MQIVSPRSVVLLGFAAASPLLAMASCGSQPSYFSGDDSGSGGSSGASGGGASDDASGSDATLGSSGGSSGGGHVDASLVMYDGPPPNVDGGLLSCATPNGLPIKFNPIYSGYDGTHAYKVPAFVEGADPATLTWGSSDPSMVSFAPYVSGIMITTQKAGDVTIIARSGSKCGSAPMHITAYTTDDWNTGNARYNNGNPLNFTTAGAGLPMGTVIPDGGIDGSYDASAVCTDPMFANLMNPFETPPAQCTNCHGDFSNGMIIGLGTIFSDVQHTPEQTGGFSDDVLTNVFVNGTIPDGGTFDQNITPYCLWQRWHKWQDMDSGASQTGMRAYLRSLTPQEQLGCFELFNMMMCADGG